MVNPKMLIHTTNVELYVLVNPTMSIFYDRYEDEDVNETSYEDEASNAAISGFVDLTKNVDEDESKTSHEVIYEEYDEEKMKKSLA